MGFNFEDHELNACVEYFGGPPCWRCDPNGKEPDLEFTFKITDQNRKAIEALFGRQVPAG